MINRKPQIRRAPGWTALRNKHLKAHPSCAACGARKHLVAHHIMPVHLFQELELDPKNLITLCEGSTLNCHVWAGHLGWWRSFNSTVAVDAAKFLERVKTRPNR